MFKILLITVAAAGITAAAKAGTENSLRRGRFRNHRKADQTYKIPAAVCSESDETEYDMDYMFI